MILNYGTNDIVIPDDLEWVDEFDWSEVEQDKSFSIGGNLIIQESKKLAGRPMTLIGGAHVWVPRSLVETLQAEINTVDKTYTLTLPDTRQFNVKFDRTQKAMEAKPIWRKRVQTSADNYTLTLRFMVV